MLHLSVADYYLLPPITAETVLSLRTPHHIDFLVPKEMYIVCKISLFLFTMHFSNNY